MGQGKTYRKILSAILAISMVPIFTIGTKKLIKRHNLKKNKRTKILSLDNISQPITLEELKRLEASSGHRISDRARQLDDDASHMEIDLIDKQFAGNKCCKKFIFCGKRLSICSYLFDKSCGRSNARQIYKELIKINGKPDRKNYDRKICRWQYTWYGRNGRLVYYKFYGNMVVIVFEIEK